MCISPLRVILQGKRAEREIQIEHMIDQVRGLLRGHGIDAAVYGRAKHIYSIWKKDAEEGGSTRRCT